MSLQVILASQSPRRKELLERLGFAVKAIPSQVPEERGTDELPDHYVKRLARDKALSVVQRVRSVQPDAPLASQRISRVTGKTVEEGVRWVIGADTVVVFGSEVLEKPRDNLDAYDMLMNLSGREHTVITGFCIYDLKREKEGIQAVRTTVRFKPLSKNEVERYVAVGESMDKAGAYAIQGVGSYLVESITGSYTNVVGLPLCQVIQMMEEMGATDFLP
jgi:septum formation protein